MAAMAAAEAAAQPGNARRFHKRTVIPWAQINRRA
jgi:hypothetical protein